MEARVTRRHARVRPGAMAKLFVAICLLAVHSACEPRLREGGGGGAGSLPAPATLRSRDGKEIEVTILGKREDEIAIRRETDGKRYVLSLSRLGERDLAWISGLDDENPEVFLEIAGENSPVSAAPAGSAKPFSFQRDWHGSIDAAFEASRKSGRPVMLVFTGGRSYPHSAPSRGADFKADGKQSRSLIRGVLNDRGFKTFAADRTEPVHVSFFEDADADVGQVPGRFTVVRGVRMDGFPSIAIFDGATGYVDQISGYYGDGPNAVIRELERIISAAR